MASNSIRYNSLLGIVHKIDSPADPMVYAKRVLFSLKCEESATIFLFANVRIISHSYKINTNSLWWQQGITIPPAFVPFHQSLPEEKAIVHWLWDKEFSLPKPSCKWFFVEKPLYFDPFGQIEFAPVGHNIIDPCKVLVQGSILFYPFRDSGFS